MPDRLIKLPKRFFDDHAERGLPTPDVIREYARSYAVSINDPELSELLSDAEHYADAVDQAERGLITSARATRRAIIMANETKAASPASMKGQ
jgi:hypothetical protein